jgi:hypothetical protein
LNAFAAARADAPHRELWQALLALSRRFGDALWACASKAAPRTVADAVNVYLRNAGYDAPHIVYACLQVCGRENDLICTLNHTLLVQPLLRVMPRGADVSKFSGRLLGSLWSATGKRRFARYFV